MPSLIAMQFLGLSQVVRQVVIPSSMKIKIVGKRPF